MKFVAISLLLLAAPAFAQTQQPSPDQIQNMINQVQQQGQAHGQRITINSEMIMAAMGAHSCMQEKIGKAGMKKLEESGKALQASVKPLCAAGKRDEAMERQQAYAKSMMASPEYAGVRYCADQYKDAFKGPPFDDILSVIEQPDKTEKHICDYQKK